MAPDRLPHAQSAVYLIMIFFLISSALLIYALQAIKKMPTTMEPQVEGHKQFAARLNSLGSVLLAFHSVLSWTVLVHSWAGKRESVPSERSVRA